jgi:TFIIS helical bundle-like domain
VEETSIRDQSVMNKHLAGDQFDSTHPPGPADPGNGGDAETGVESSSGATAGHCGPPIIPSELETTETSQLPSEDPLAGGPVAASDAHSVQNVEGLPVGADNQLQTSGTHSQTTELLVLPASQVMLATEGTPQVSVPTSAIAAAPEASVNPLIASGLQRPPLDILGQVPHMVPPSTLGTNPPVAPMGHFLNFMQPTPLQTMFMRQLAALSTASALTPQHQPTLLPQGQASTGLQGHVAGQGAVLLPTLQGHVAGQSVVPLTALQGQVGGQGAVPLPALQGHVAGQGAVPLPAQPQAVQQFPSLLATNQAGVGAAAATEQPTPSQSVPPPQTLARTVSAPSGTPKAEGSEDSGEAKKRKRRAVMPRIMAGQRCGTCHTCRNPQMKKACETRRREFAEATAAAEASGISAGTSQTGSAEDPQSNAKSDAKRHKPNAADSATVDSATTEAPHAGPPPAGAPPADPPPDAPQAPPKPDDRLHRELQEILNRTGGLKDTNSVSRFEKLMEGAATLNARKVLLTVINQSQRATLSALVHGKGLGILEDWLLQARESEKHVGFVAKILASLQNLPVDLQGLKTCTIGKRVSNLARKGPPEFQKAAASLVAAWKKAVEVSGDEGYDSPHGRLPAAPPFLFFSLFPPLFFPLFFLLLVVL